MSGLSRRQTLALGMVVAGGAGLSGVGLGAAPAVADDDEYATLLGRWTVLLTGGDFDADDPDFARALSDVDDAAARVWKTMDPSPQADTPWPDLPLSATDGVNANACLDRLLSLATAWATNGAALSGDADVLAGILAGLDVVYRKRYHEGASELGNWWNWEIGAPMALAQTCVLVADRLPDEQLDNYLRVIDHFVPNADRRTNMTDFPETGANRMDKAVIVALAGILGRDSGKLELSRDGVSDLRDEGRYSIFRYVTVGDGFYADGSFIQHDHVPYVGSYGVVLLTDIARLMMLLSGSSWAITDPKQNVVLDAVEASYAPFMTNGAMADCVRGRAISRMSGNDHDIGHEVVGSTLLLADGAPDRYGPRFRELASGWIRRDWFAPYLASAGLPEIAAAKALLADGSVRPAPEPVYHRQFPNQDRIVHRRRDWSFTLGLSSDRIYRYECGNGENLHGWYTGDGMAYLYTAADLGQFGDGYWPTVDPYRLPGTTIGTEHRDDTASHGTSGPMAFDPWVGGTDLAGRYGAVGMEFTSYDETITGRKSWFCIDDAVVCLGAGITRTDDTHPVESIVEQRNLHADGANRLLVDARQQPAANGWSATFGRPRWAHLAGVGGYVFDGRTPLRALRAERTGRWSDIDTGADTAGTDDPVTRRYLTMWFDHGAGPRDADYVYVLLPTASVSDTIRWSRRPNARVLANTARVQAVRVQRPGMLLANFFAADQVDGLRTDGPASVALNIERHQITVAVSDPSRTGDSLTIGLPMPVRQLVSADESVALDASRPRGQLRVAVGGSSGTTHRAVLSR